MGKTTNKMYDMMLNNWEMNGKRILSAIGVCIIAILIALVDPVVSTLMNMEALWGTFYSKSYDYLTILAVYIVGVVFGSRNGENGHEEVH